MTLLLDTNAFLWFVAGDKRLGARAGARSSGTMPR